MLLFCSKKTKTNDQELRRSATGSILSPDEPIKAKSKLPSSARNKTTPSHNKSSEFESKVPSETTLAALASQIEAVSSRVNASLEDLSLSTPVVVSTSMLLSGQNGINNSSSSGNSRSNSSSSSNNGILRASYDSNTSELDGARNDVDTTTTYSSHSLNRQQVRAQDQVQASQHVLQNNGQPSSARSSFEHRVVNSLPYDNTTAITSAGASAGASVGASASVGAMHIVATTTAMAATATVPPSENISDIDKRILALQNYLDNARY